jgi:hypothetical protein
LLKINKRVIRQRLFPCETQLEFIFYKANSLHFQRFSGFLQRAHCQHGNKNFPVCKKCALYRGLEAELKNNFFPEIFDKKVEAERGTHFVF